MKYISIGGTRYVRSDDVSSVLELDGNSGRGYIQHACEKKLCVEVPGSRTAKSAIIMKSGYVMYSELRVETILKRLEDE